MGKTHGNVHIWNIYGETSMKYKIYIYIYKSSFPVLMFQIMGKNIGTHMRIFRNQENIWWFPSMGYPKIDGLQWNILFKWMIWGYPYFWKLPYEHHLYMGTFPLLIQSWPFYFCFFTVVVCGRYFDLPSPSLTWTWRPKNVPLTWTCIWSKPVNSH